MWLVGQVNVPGWKPVASRQIDSIGYVTSAERYVWLNNLTD